MLNRAGAVGLAIVFALVSFAGCGWFNGGGQPAGPLSLSLEVPSAVREGERVTLKLILENVSDRPIELWLEDPGSIDFVVTKPDGAEVWRFLQNEEAIPPDLSRKTLDPGQELKFEAHWWQQAHYGFLPYASPGTYSVLGLARVRLDVATPQEREVELETDPKPFAIREESTPYLALQVEVPSEVQAGETVPLKLTLKNVGDEAVELGLGGREDSGFAGSYDFAVSTPDGAPLWRWQPWRGYLGEAFEDILSSVALDPGEELVFEGWWSEVDGGGKPVPLGRYLVHGFLYPFLDVSSPDERTITLETEPRSLAIVAPNGQAAQPLSLFLEVPSEVQAGETVPLKLILKNISDRPLELSLADLPDRVEVEFRIIQPDGNLAWPSSGPSLEGQPIADVSWPKALDPGEELPLDSQWDQMHWTGPVPPGAYTVVGSANVRVDVDMEDEKSLTLEAQPKPLIIVAE